MMIYNYENSKPITKIVAENIIYTYITDDIQAVQIEEL